MEAITWVTPLPSHTFFTFLGRIKTGMLPYEINEINKIYNWLIPVKTSIKYSFYPINKTSLKLLRV
jgi:hypothetical protein